MKRKLFAALLALIMVLCLLPMTFTPQTAEAEGINQTIVQGGAILHCFDWSYNEIRTHLQEIKDAGYVAVQTSPVQPAKDYNAAWTDTSGNWWKLYQPLGLRIAESNETWLGSKTDLTTLCSEAETLGIKVIVDIVANHVANNSGGGFTINGTYNVSSQVDEQLQDRDGTKGLYHTSEYGVNDGNRYTMTQYQMGMPDLNTSNATVQEYVLNLLKECVDCGVDGFRFDAAKHIELPNDADCGSPFWQYILSNIRAYADGTGNRASQLYIYGESLSGNGRYDNWVNEFTTLMGLTDSQTGNSARSAVKDANAGSLAIGDYQRGTNPQDYVLWAESHDTYLESGDHATRNIEDKYILRTWAIVGARANSTALFFARPNEQMGKASTDTSWKSSVVTEVNKFNTYANNHGFGEYFSYDGNTNMVTLLERGNENEAGAGTVIVKLDGAGAVTEAVYRMRNGTYKDSITGNLFTVSNGTISGTVGPTGVAVVYETATAPEPSAYITADPIYFVPTGWWTNANARFEMWLFDNNNVGTFVSLTDADGDGVYEGALAPGNWTGVVFVRMNPNGSEHDWNSKWNQTVNLVPDVGTNCCTVVPGDGDTSTGTWSVYDGGTTGDPNAGYYLVGTMTGWGVLPEFKMTESQNAGIYTYETTLLRTSTSNSQFKVVYSSDGVSVDTWYPDGVGNAYGDTAPKYADEIPQSGVYSISFNPAGNVAGWHEGYLNAERTKFFVTVDTTDKNGTVTVDKDVAAQGETVNVTVTPNTGYELDSLVYMCETGFNTGTFTTTTINGTSFTMPPENAAVKATFKPILTNGYYLIGPDWTVDSIDTAKKFAENTQASGEYMLTTTLTLNQQIKVVKVENGAITAWYPNGTDDQYHVDAAHAGDSKTIYFKPAGSNDEAWAAFGGYIYIEGKAAEAGYYLIGMINGTENWNNINPAYKLEENPAVLGEFMIDQELKTTDQFKVVYSKDGTEKTTWYPTTNGNYGENSEIHVDGVHHIYFRPGYNGGSDWFENCIYTAHVKWGYFLVGSFNNWALEADYKLTKNEFADTDEYYIVTNLPANTKLKVLYSPDAVRRSDTDYFPSGDNTEFTINDAGIYRIYFRPKHDGENGWHYQYIYAENVTEPIFTSQSLTMDAGVIGVNFYMALPDGPDYSNSSMTFTIPHGTPSEKTVNLAGMQPDAKKGYYKFTFEVNSIQMAETITATFHYTQNGQENTETKTFSVQDYFTGFDKVANQYDSKTVNLVHALANYGYYAQHFLEAEKTTWSFADGNYVEMTKYYDGIDDQVATLQNEYLNMTALNKVGSTNFPASGITYSLILDSATAINVFFTPDGYTETPNVTVTSGGTAITQENYEVTKVGNRWRVQIKNIQAQDLDKSFAVTLNAGGNVDGDGSTNGATVTVAALCYVRSMMVAANADGNWAYNATKDQWKQAAAAIKAYNDAANAFVN